MPGGGAVLMTGAGGATGAVAGAPAPISGCAPPLAVAVPAFCCSIAMMDAKVPDELLGAAVDDVDDTAAAASERKALGVRSSDVKIPRPIQLLITLSIA